MIATLRLTGAAKLFYNGCPELHAADVTWDKFKVAFYQRFRDVHSVQFHFMQLQTAQQRKGESQRKFADRCRALANKVMCKVGDPAAQRIHRGNADRMMLASFISGLSDVVGTEVRYQAPRDIEQAVSLALAVQEAEKQEKFNETFYTRIDNSVRLLSRSPSRPSRVDRKPRRMTNTQADGRCEVSATILHVTLAGRRTQRLRTRRPKLPLGALSAKGLGTSRGSAPRG